MSNPKSPVLDAERRAWNYWFVDGLPHILAGLACMLIAAVIVFAQTHPRRPWIIGLTFAAVLGYLAIMIRMRQITEWLKGRITYPRTGYAAPPYFTEGDPLSPDLTTLELDGADARRASDAERLHAYRKHKVWLMIALIGVAIIATQFIASSWICLAAGFIAGAALFASRKNERISWIGIAAFPLAGVFLLLPGPPERSALFVGGGGLMLTLAGAVTLFRYLRANPRPNA